MANKQHEPAALKPDVRIGGIGQTGKKDSNANEKAEFLGSFFGNATDFAGRYCWVFQRPAGFGISASSLSLTVRAIFKAVTTALKWAE